MSPKPVTAKTRALKLSQWLPALLMLALALAFLSRPVAADHHEQKVDVREAAVSVAAVITDIDYETREFTMQLPHGNFVTMTAGEGVARFKEFEVGDAIVATYLTSLAGEVRAPTEEEKAEPWQELDAAMIAGMEERPGVAGMRVIKAVCTIEGMNRVAGTVMIEDPRGKYHLIGDVAPEKFKGRMLGETVIIVYSEAVALTLEKAEDMAAE
ncbi:MAG: hypothetical protein ABJ308_01670 [Halieaceae bacterium]